MNTNALGPLLLAGFGLNPSQRDRGTFALSIGCSKKSLFIWPKKPSETGCHSPKVRFALDQGLPQAHLQAKLTALSRYDSPTSPIALRQGAQRLSPTAVYPPNNFPQCAKVLYDDDTGTKGGRADEARATAA